MLYYRLSDPKLQHNFVTDDAENPYFAVKELASSNRQDEKFENEVGAWAKSVGVIGHQHIIRLLATWQQHNSWYLLFPWAEGNLEDYWKENPGGNQPEENEGSPKREASRRRGLAQWVGKQLMGLAEGLTQIHRPPSDAAQGETSEVMDYGIHGDIKPHNILRFKDKDDEPGRLVICDFGFTRFHSRASRSAANSEGDSLTYRAPECDQANRGGVGGFKISRACDMWALGCVFLEFMVWCLQGFEEVEEFTKERVEGHISYNVRHDTFFLQPVDQLPSPDAIVKPCV